MSEDSWLTPKDVSEMFRVTTQTVRMWIRAGRLEALRVGKGWRINPTALCRMMSATQKS